MLYYQICSAFLLSTYVQFGSVYEERHLGRSLRDFPFGKGKHDYAYTGLQNNNQLPHSHNPLTDFVFCFSFPLLSPKVLYHIIIPNESRERPMCRSLCVFIRGLSFSVPPLQQQTGDDCE